MRALTNEYNFTHMQTVLGENLRLALWPWDPGEITVYRTDSYLEPVWLIKVGLLPALPFRYDGAAVWKYTPRPDEVLYDIAIEAFNFFRERPSLPVDDHIILGEE